MALLFLLVKDSFIDDAYISLGYARNLALHFHWGLIADETSNTVTSPLHALLLGGATALTRLGGGVHPVLALGALSVGLAAALAWAWTRIVRALSLSWWVAPAGVALVLLNPFLLSAIGLETLLTAAVLTALVAIALEGRATWFGVVAGLALLTRPDLVVFVVVVAAASASIRRRWVPALTATAVVAAPWYVFSWLHFGSAVPDTLLLKTSQPGSWGQWNIVTGPAMYYISDPATTVLAFLPAALGVVSLCLWLLLRAGVRWPGESPLAASTPVAGFALGGLAYLLAFAGLGLGPYHWYYGPAIVALSTFLVVALGTWQRQAHATVRLRTAAPVAGLALVGAIAAAGGGRDLSEGVPWPTSVVSTNWATASDYARVGAALGRRVGPATVESPGEIGTLAYFCHCRIVDAFSDRGYLPKLVDDKIHRAGFPASAFYRLNYHRLDRGQRPPRVYYRLRYAPGPASGPGQWEVWSPWRGVGHLTLSRA